MNRPLIVAVLDPAVGRGTSRVSGNLGDAIIQQAVTRELERVSSSLTLHRISTQRRMTADDFRAIRGADVVVVGGSNLLSSRMRPYNRWNAQYDRWSNQWSINLLDALRIGRAILLGVGWIAYQGSPDLSTRIMLQAALSSEGLHSVRDEYSRAHLVRAGIRNVVNTGCVTMWPLAERDLRRVPTARAETALVMLTDYAREPDIDRQLLDLLQRRYQQVFAWPQGKGDAAYLGSLGFTGTMLEHSLEDLEGFLGSGTPFDYIGTRLHGGLRCLNDFHRSLVLEIDNRAAEIAKDTHLPTARRDDFVAIEAWIDGGAETALRLNRDGIDRWRAEIRESVASIVASPAVEYAR